MINSTNTVNIDGDAIREFDLKSFFAIEQDDSFTRWVVRPLAILAAIGVGVAVFFASAVLVMVSLALLPVLAVAIWAMKTKLARDVERSGANTASEAPPADTGPHGQTAS